MVTQKNFILSFGEMAGVLFVRCADKNDGRYRVVEVIPRFKNEFDFLCNFYTAPFVWNGRCWPTVEHAFQAAKIPSPGDFQQVITAKTPVGAKRLGRRVKLRDDWEEVKVVIMTELVWLKFEHNLTLREKLIDTGSVELIEGNWWHDNFWGDCFCRTCSNHPGKNVLGSILMEVREDFQKSLDPWNPSRWSMTKEQKLREAVFLYIEAKKALTKCMGQHFRQVCHNCKKYAECLIYSGYCSAWMHLQDSYYVEKDGKNDISTRNR